MAIYQLICTEMKSVLINYFSNNSMRYKVRVINGLAARKIPQKYSNYQKHFLQNNCSSKLIDTKVKN